MNKTKLPKELIPSEHEEQANVISWAKQQVNVYPALVNLFAVPNAAKRSFGNAKYCKADGLVAGVPDLILAVQNNLYGSLYIEMKKNGRQNEKNGGLSDAQMKWKQNLCAYGMQVITCYSAQEAIDAILSYLADRNTGECALVSKTLNCS